MSAVPWAVAEQTQSTPTHLCGPPYTVRPRLDTGPASPLAWEREREREKERERERERKRERKRNRERI